MAKPDSLADVAEPGIFPQLSTGRPFPFHTSRRAGLLAKRESAQRSFTASDLHRLLQSSANQGVHSPTLLFNKFPHTRGTRPNFFSLLEGFLSGLDDVMVCWPEARGGEEGPQRNGPAHAVDACRCEPILYLRPKGACSPSWRTRVAFAVSTLEGESRPWASAEGAPSALLFLELCPADGITALSPP